MNTSGPQTTAAHPSSAESNCLPLPCAFGAAEASDSIGGGERGWVNRCVNVSGGVLPLLV